ncbi:MAG: hypothetical protein J6Q06_04690, partial [Clostridia bacterium]|nr:hypothetical protein [Clostridia bacterium]
MLVYACECNSTFIDTDDDKPKLEHDWSDWDRGDAVNAEHNRKCSICSMSETQLCSVDKDQRLGYIVSDGVNGKLIAAQYICTICNQPANDVCDEEVIPVANEAELKAAISAGRSVIFENDIHVTSTIDIDCNLGNDIIIDLNNQYFTSYNCALLNIYDSDGQSIQTVTIKNGNSITTDADSCDICCPIAFVYNEVKLIIEYGDFDNLASNELFVVRNHAELWIKGGRFIVTHDGYSGVYDAFCSEHNGVIDLIDETGVDHDGSAYCSQAEFFGWEYDRDEDGNGKLIILDGSHAIGGYIQGEYSIEYCQYDAGVVTEPGCCQAYGYTTYTCKVCPYSYKDNFVDPVPCVLSWKDNGDGTCTEACHLPCSKEICNGEVMYGPIAHIDTDSDYSCDNCGAHIHKYDAGVVTEPGCCNAYGYTTYTCLICSQSYKGNIVDALPCELAWRDNGDGTCSSGCFMRCSEERGECNDPWSDGPFAHIDDENLDEKCDRCGADMHVHNYVPVETIRPTCTEDGYTLSKCSCGDSKKSNYVANVVCDFVWTNLENGTCQKICSFGCGDTEGEPLAHTCEWRKHGDGTHNVECYRCGIIDKAEPCYGGTADCQNQAVCAGCGDKYGDLGEHTPNGEGVVTEPGCCGADGYTTYVCQVCETEYRDNIVDSIRCVISWVDNGDGTCTNECVLRCGRTGGCNEPTDGPYSHVNKNGDMACDNCGAHIHRYSATVTEPTCLEDGHTIYDCDGCDHYYFDDEKDQLGHDFTKYVDHEDGTHTLYCSRERC